MRHSLVLGFGRNPVYIRAEKQKIAAPECVFHLWAERRAIVCFGGRKSISVAIEVCAGSQSCHLQDLCEHQAMGGGVGIAGKGRRQSLCLGLGHGAALGTVWKREAAKKSLRESFREQRGRSALL